MSEAVPRILLLPRLPTCDHELLLTLHIVDISAFNLNSNLRFHKWFGRVKLQGICLCVSGSAVVQAKIATAAFCPTTALTCAFECVCWILSILLFFLSICAYVETMVSIWVCMFFIINAGNSPCVLRFQVHWANMLQILVFLDLCVAFSNKQRTTWGK